MKRVFLCLAAVLIAAIAYASFVELSGIGLYFPHRVASSPGTPTFNTTTLSATGQKFAWTGKVYFPDHSATKNISRVGFCWGTVVNAGGSGYIVSLEDMELSTTTASLPGHPDLIRDQSVAVKSSTEIVTNSWIRTSTFDTVRTVSYGDLLSVVVEFDAAGRLGADTAQIRGLTYGSGTEAVVLGVSVSSLSVAAPWTAVTVMPNLLLEFDDGSVGLLGEESTVWSAINTIAYNSGSQFDEYALAFTLPFPAKVDGLRVQMTPSVSSQTLTLYQGTSILQSVAIASATLKTTAGWLMVPIPETSLSANTSYYVGLRNLSTTNISAYNLVVSTLTPGIMKAAAGGFGVALASRKQGSWTISPSTGTFMAGVRISALDNGSGGTKGYPFSQ